MGKEGMDAGWSPLSLVNDEGTKDILEQQQCGSSGDNKM